MDEHGDRAWAVRHRRDDRGKDGEVCGASSTLLIATGTPGDGVYSPYGSGTTLPGIG